MNKKIKQKILGIAAVTLGLLTIIGLATTLGIVSNVSNKKDENIIVDPIVNSVLDQNEKLKTDLRAVRLVKNAISKDLLIAETENASLRAELEKEKHNHILSRRLLGKEFLIYKTRAKAYIKQLEAQLEQRLEKI